MKLKWPLLVLLMAVLLVPMSGCVNSNADVIVGTWNSNATGVDYASYTFNSDGTFTCKSGISDFNGSWKNIGDNQYTISFHDPMTEQDRSLKMVYDDTLKSLYYEESPEFRYMKA